MPFYDVEIVFQAETTICDVEAENEEDAKKKASALFRDGKWDVDGIDPEIMYSDASIVPETKG